MNPSGPQPSGGETASGGSDWIGALIGLGTVLVNNYQQKDMATTQNQTNREMATTAYQRDLAQWNRQNEYNSPLAQMQRWKEAGLNPNLIYGGSNSGGNAASSPSARVPQTVPVPGMLSNMPNMLQMYQDFQLRSAQIDNVKANTDRTQQATVTDTFNASLKRIMGERADVALGVESKYSGEMGHFRLEQARKTSRNLGMKWALMDEQSQINHLRMDQMRKGLTIQDAQKNKLDAEVEYKRNENSWRAAGFTSSDHPAFRVLLTIAKELGLR